MNFFTAMKEKQPEPNRAKITLVSSWTNAWNIAPKKKKKKRRMMNTFVWTNTSWRNKLKYQWQTPQSAQSTSVPPCLSSKAVHVRFRINGETCWRKIAGSGKHHLSLRETPWAWATFLEQFIHSSKVVKILSHSLMQNSKSEFLRGKFSSLQEKV